MILTHGNRNRQASNESAKKAIRAQKAERGDPMTSKANRSVVGSRVLGAEVEKLTSGADNDAVGYR